MKKAILLSIFALFITLGLCAQAKAGGAKNSAKEPPKAGFIFAFQNLLDAIMPFNDGYQNGAGMKLWFGKNLAARALLGFNFNAPQGGVDTTTLISLGAGAEYHLKPGKASPYLGGLIGTRMDLSSGQQAALDFYLGGMAGAEIQILDNLAIYGEYQLKLVLDSMGTTISLADIANPAKGAVFGFILYF